MTPCLQHSKFSTGSGISNEIIYCMFCRISFDGELLDIISVEVEDSGRFTCEALNPAGKISKDFVIIVQGLQ